MDLIEKNKQSYNKIAKLWSFSRQIVWADLELFQKHIKPGFKILDLGCGNGRLLELLVKEKVEYLGIDHSQGMIKQARQNYPQHSFRVSDWPGADWPENEFDLVFCVAVLNHIPQKKQKEFLRAVNRTLKPGGKLLMTNWNMWNIKGRKSVWKRDNEPKAKFKQVYTTWKSGEAKEKLFYYAFTKRELKKLLIKSGFRVLENFYSREGQKVNMFLGHNIVSVAEKREKK